LLSHNLQYKEVRGFPSVKKRSRRGVVHFPASDIEVKNNLSYSPALAFSVITSIRKTNFIYRIIYSINKILPRTNLGNPGGGVEVYIYFFFNLGARWGWMINATPLPLYPRERESYPLRRRMSGSQGQTGWVRKIELLSGFDPRSLKRVASRYTNYAVSAHTIYSIGNFYLKISDYLATLRINVFNVTLRKRSV
jgi:hypothetical protein